MTRGGPAAAVSNPIVAALIITVLAFIVFFALMHEYVAFSECPWRLRARAALYMFLAASLVLALAYHGIARKHKSVQDQQAREGIVHQIHGIDQMQARPSSNVQVLPQSIFSQPLGAYQQPAPAYPQPAPAPYPQQAAPYPPPAPLYPQQAPPYQQQQGAPPGTLAAAAEPRGMTGGSAAPYSPPASMPVPTPNPMRLSLL